MYIHNRWIIWAVPYKGVTMGIVKKISIGCLGVFLAIPLLFLVMAWIGEYKSGYYEYARQCQMMNAYLETPDQKVPYKAELARIISTEEHPGTYHHSDVLFADIFPPFRKELRKMGYEKAVEEFGTSEEIKEKIYLASKAALDSGNYNFASRFFMVLSEYDYKDSKELMVEARSKNRHGLSVGDIFNWGLRKWGVDGSFAPTPWQVAGQMGGFFLLKADRPVELRVLDKNFCDWLKSEMFSDLFFDGSAAAIVPLDSARLEYLAKDVKDTTTSRLFCQELGNKIFLHERSIFSYVTDHAYDNLFSPYFSDRYKKVRDSLGVRECCRVNGFPWVANQVDSVISVVPWVFVDTLLLR